MTFSYDNVIFLLEPSDQAKTAIGKRITVVDRPERAGYRPLKGSRVGLPHLATCASFAAAGGGDCREQANWCGRQLDARYSGLKPAVGDDRPR